jgi:hypothetical protein
MLAVSLVTIAFILSQSGSVSAQTNVTTSGGTINKIPKWTASTALSDSIIWDSGTNVGIGTTSPAKKLHVSGGQIAIDNLRFLYSKRTNGNFQEAFGIDSNDDIIFNRNSIVAGVDGDAPKAPSALIFGTGAAKFFDIRNSSNVSLVYVLESSGSVGIGTTSPTGKLHVVGDVTLTGTGNIVNSGNITATGTIQGGNVIAKYQDVAEWVPASYHISAGTVVVLDTERSNHVLASSHAYDTRVAGVVSASPGVLLGEGGAGKVMVATTGRVRVKVDATLGPIRVGDLLVTSDKEGIAMRSQPLDLGGTPIHRPGTLIGKALEPLEKGVGEILVLLSLQ